MRQMHLIFFLSFSLVYFRYLKANLIPFGKYVYSIWNSILSLLSFCSVHCTSFTEYLTNGVQELQEHIFDLFPPGRFWVRPGPSVQDSIFLSEGQRCHSQLSGEFWFAYHFKLSIRFAVAFILIIELFAIRLDRCNSVNQWKNSNQMHKLIDSLAANRYLFLRIGGKGQRANIIVT